MADFSGMNLLGLATIQLFKFCTVSTQRPSNCGCFQAQADIEDLKLHLEEAKIERQHKEECEAIRKLIAAQSPRADTQRQLNELQKELVVMEADNFAASRTLELRKKQFGLLLHVVSHFHITEALVVPSSLLWEYNTLKKLVELFPKLKKRS